MIKERPILFSGPMVQALIAGRKTQTRRVIKPQPKPENTEAMTADPTGFWFAPADGEPNDTTVESWDIRHSPYGEVGDRLYVKESFHILDRGTHCGRAVRTIKYVATDDEVEPAYGTEKYDMAMNYPAPKSVPSLFMPKLFSRTLLEIVSVRVERLQQISESDARAEGIKTTCPCAGGCDQHRIDFMTLWDSINGADEAKNWDANPWVFVIEFKVIEGGAK